MIKDRENRRGEESHKEIEYNAKGGPGNRRVKSGIIYKRMENYRVAARWEPAIFRGPSQMYIECERRERIRRE